MLSGSGGKRNQWLQQSAGEPTKPGSATLRFCSLPRCPAKRTQASRSRVASWCINLPTSGGDEVRIGARRLVALVAPGLVRGPRLALAEELQRLGARLIAQHLALKMRGDGEDFQPVLLGEIDALLGVGRGAGVGVALAQVQLPARFFPAVEAGVRDELDPARLRHVAELAADQADLVVRPLAEAVS